MPVFRGVLSGFILIIPLAVGSAGLAQVQRPATMPAAPTRPITYADRYEMMRAGWHDQFLAVYRGGKHRNAKWDAKVELFLGNVAKRFASQDIIEWYWPGNLPAITETAAAGEEAFAAGCRDPLFQGLLLVAHFQANRSDLAGRHVAEAVAGLEKSNAPHLAVSEIFRVASILTTLNLDERARLARLSRERLIEACCQKPSTLNRTLVSLEVRERYAPQLPELGKLAASLKARTDCDPAIFNWVAGKNHELMGWEKRGTKSASQTTADQFRGLREEMTLAQTHLTRAWQLAPDLPFAASDMIYVSMGLGRDARETPQVWFERSLAAQMDYRGAFANIRIAMSPRWGGKLEDLLTLAEVSAVKPRYDTTIPWEYVTTMRFIGRDVGQPWLPLQDDKIYAKVIELCDGYAKARGPGNDAFVRTAAVAVSLRAGRTQQARDALLRMINDKVQPDPAAFTEFSFTGDLAILPSRILAETGPHAQELSAVMEFAKSGENRAEAVDRLKKVASVLPKDDHSGQYIRRLIDLYEADQKFEAGDWVAMQVGTVMSNWIVADGNWTANADGSLDGGADIPMRGKTLLWRGAAINRDVGTSFEIAFNIRKLPEPIIHAHDAGGLVLYSTALKRRALAVVETHHDRYGFVFFEPQNKAWWRDIPEDAAVKVRVANDQIRMFINGEPVGEPQELPESFRNDLQIGIGGFDGSPIRFSNLRIRKVLPDEAGPPAAAEKDAPAMLPSRGAQSRPATKPAS